MTDRERTESGQFAETVTLDDILGVFNQVRGPVITSSDVADALGCTTEAARQKLTRLYDRGRVEKRKTGRTTIYWRTEDAAERESTTPSVERSEDAPTPAGSDAPRELREATEAREDVADVIEAVDTPGSGETARERERALREAYEYLRENGTAQRSDFEDLLGDDVGYNGGFDSWWSNYVKAKDALKQLPGVEAPSEGEHYWEIHE